MVRVNALTMLLLIEAVFVFAAIAGYLFYRLRKSGGTENSGNFKKQLFGMVERKIATTKEPSGEDVKNFETGLLQELQSARQRLLTVAAGTVRSAAGADGAWEALYASVDDVVKALLSGKREVLAEREALQKKLEGMGAEQGDLRRLQEIIVRQASRIAELFSYKDRFAESRQEIAAVEGANGELKKKIAELLKNSAKTETANMLLSEFERTNGDLKRCVSDLEREHQSLTEDYAAWQKELKALEEGNDFVREAALRSGSPASHAAGDQHARITELESALEAREKELKEVRRKLESLEQEYLVLYKENT